MSDLMINLVVAECTDAVAAQTDTPAKLRAAFKAARNSMVTDEMLQFKGALGAVLDSVKGTPDYDRLETEIRFVGQFNAFVQACASGVAAEMPKAPENFEPYRIMDMWNQSHPREIEKQAVKDKELAELARLMAKYPDIVATITHQRIEAEYDD